MKLSRKLFAILAGLILLSGAIGSTETIQTIVHFNIASVIGFELTLLGETPVVSNGGAETTDIEFNTTTVSANFTEARVVGGSVQSDGNPIFVYKNIGTELIDINVYLNATIPTCIKLYGDNTYTKAGNVIGTTNVSVATNLAVDTTANWYMWANFTSCSVADICTKNLTSIGGI